MGSHKNCLAEGTLNQNYPSIIIKYPHYLFFCTLPLRACFSTSSHLQSGEFLWILKLPGIECLLWRSNDVSLGHCQVDWIHLYVFGVQWSANRIAENQNILEWEKWAATWLNQQNCMCAQRRLRSAWTSAQSDQSLRCLPEESSGP